MVWTISDLKNFNAKLNSKCLKQTDRHSDGQRMNEQTVIRQTVYTPRHVGGGGGGGGGHPCPLETYI